MIDEDIKAAKKTLEEKRKQVGAMIEGLEEIQETLTTTAKVLDGAHKELEDTRLEVDGARDDLADMLHELAEAALSPPTDEEARAWRAFALKVARLLASPGAEDMAALTTSDLPDVLECLRGTLRERGQAIRRLRTRVAELEAEVASLRALADGALITAETMAAGVRR